MSGLAGVWNFDGQPADRALLRSLAGTIAHRGGDHFGVWSDGPIGFTCQLGRVVPQSLNERQPIVDGAGTALVFDGRLDNREDLLRAMPAGGVKPDAPDSALVMGAWNAWGHGFLARLSGDFALALFDAGAQALVLARDPVGCRPLYYWTDGARFVFASEIKAILAHPGVRATPNDDLLADFFLLERLPYEDNGDTFFQGIQAVRAGHQLNVSNGQILSEQFWDFDPQAEIRYGTYGEYAEHLRALLIQSVKRRLRSSHPVVLATSGGLDSSVVLCIADDLQKSGAVDATLLPLSYTPPDNPATEENQFIGELERSRGLTVRRVALGEAGNVGQLERAAWHSEWPLFDDGWCAQMPMFSTAREEGARVVLTGTWSDQFFFVTGYLSDLFVRLSWRQVTGHLEEYNRWFVDAGPAYFRSRFRRHVLATLAPRPLRAWARALRGVPMRSRNHPVLSRSLISRVARRRPRDGRPLSGTAHARDIYHAVRALSHRLRFEADDKLASSYGLESVTPFLDRDVIAYLMAIPGEIQTHGGVPRALLRDSMRGIVPDIILDRRWRADGTASPEFGRGRRQAYIATRTPLRASRDLGWVQHARAVDADSLELIGLELWGRVYFADRLADLGEAQRSR